MVDDDHGDNMAWLSLLLLLLSHPLYLINKIDEIDWFFVFFSHTQNFYSKNSSINDKIIIIIIVGWLVLFFFFCCTRIIASNKIGLMRLEYCVCCHMFACQNTWYHTHAYNTSQYNWNKKKIVWPNIDWKWKSNANVNF